MHPNGSRIGMRGTCSALLLIAVACASAPRVHSAIVSPQEPREASAKVEFISGAPSRPHIVIGNVVVEQPPHLGGDADASACMAALKAEVLRMGGDAVVQFEFHAAPAGTQGAGSYTAQGVVVKWLDRGAR